jgi:hypothetical protein
VVLIESGLPIKAPLPVLTRGKDDSGIKSQADVLSPFPDLTGILLPKSQESARPGDVISFTGTRLDGTEVGVVFDHVDHLLTGGPIEIGVPAGPNATATQVTVTLANDPVKWPAGFYTVEVWVKPPGEDERRPTKQQVFAVAPSFSISPQTASAGDIQYTVTVSPQVRPEQKTSLLLGSISLPADDHPAPTGTLTFQAPAVVQGKYHVRLRVGGVDSILVDRTGAVPVFDPSQEVTVT